MAVEPTYGGARNAVQLFFSDTNRQPITDLGDGLKVQVVYQGQTSDELALHPAFSANFGTPGEYDAPLEPTRPGDYTFHFTGTIHGVPIDESFTSSPKTFKLGVQDDTSIEFPVKDPGRGDLSTAVRRLVDRVDPLPAKVTAVQSSARSAGDTGNRATVVAVIALVLALLTGAGLGMLLRARGNGGADAPVVEAKSAVSASRGSRD